jgi:hypothetical protein
MTVVREDFADLEGGRVHMRQPEVFNRLVLSFLDGQ